MSLLNLNFFIIYIIHKSLALFKNHLNYFKDSILECFLRSIIVDFSFLKREIFFHNIYWWKVQKKNIIKEIRNLLILIKEINHTAIKGIRNLIRLQKEIKTIKDRILRDIKNLFEHEGEEN